MIKDDKRGMGEDDEGLGEGMGEGLWCMRGGVTSLQGMVVRALIARGDTRVRCQSVSDGRM